MPEVEFPFDRQRFFHQEALHDPAFRACLVRDKCHAEHLLGDHSGFGGILHDLDAAPFSAPARMNLRFDNDAPADVLRSRLGFGDGKRHLPARHGDFVFGQNRLGLILVNFHFGAVAAIPLDCKRRSPTKMCQARPSIQINMSGLT